MKTSKEQLVHSVWDIHNNNYASVSIDVDATFISQMMANIFCPGPSYFYILDFTNRKINYVSPPIEEILGIKPKDFTLNKLLSSAHPDDLQFVVNCEEKVMDFLFNKISSDKITKYKFSYIVRLAHSDGSYRMILHQAIAISKDAFGRMSKVFCIHTDIGHLISLSNYRLSITGLEGEPSYAGIDVSKNQQDYLHQSFILFTNRELEVLRQFAEGHTAQQVGENLHIATGTVRTHRRNILKKSGCANITALVAKMIREGVI